MKRELIKVVFLAEFDLDPNYQYKPSKNGNHVFWVHRGGVELETKIKMNRDLKNCIKDALLEEYFISSITFLANEPDSIAFVMIDSNGDSTVITKKYRDIP